MNMIQNAKDQVLDLTVSAYQKAAAEGLLPQDAAVTPSVEIPKDTANGDYTTTFCLAAAKALKKNPRQVAQILMDHMDLYGYLFHLRGDGRAGLPELPPGRTSGSGDTVACVEQEGAAYGCNDTLKGQKIMVEFVSANPTGPMHMGNARGGVLGDTLASRAAEVRRRRVAGVLCQRRRQPDREVCQEPGGPVSADYQGRGRRGVPRGRLSRRRHPGAGPGLL